MSTAETDLDLALNTLRSVCADNDATPASKSQAARTLLEYYGYLGTGRTLVPDASRKSHIELSVTELQRRAAELRRNAQSAVVSTVFDD